jgi:hypothetical protein
MADTEREAFEKAFKLDQFQRRPHAVIKGDYQESGTQCAWEGWQSRAALASRPAEVDDEGTGYKMLPVVSTDEMCIAAREKIGVGSNAADHIYRAMVAAAPSHTTNKEK